MKTIQRTAFHYSLLRLKKNRLLVQSTGFGTDQSGASTATAASLVDDARALLTYSGQYQALEYTSEEHLTRCVASISYQESVVPQGSCSR